MIPKGAIGVARAALFEEAAKFHGDWDERNDALVTAALEAAAPFLRAQALEDAADELRKLQYVKPGTDGRDEYERMLAIRRGDTDAWLTARAVTERGQG